VKHTKQRKLRSKEIVNKSNTQAPVELAAERAFLGSVLLEPDVLAWAEVDRKCFYDPRHRSVYEAMVAAQSAGAIDLVTIESCLASAGKLEAVGGVPFLSELVLATPTADNAAHYVGLMREARMGRALLVLGADVRERIERGDDPEETLAHLMRSGAAVDSVRDDRTFILGRSVVAQMRLIQEGVDSGAGPTNMLKSGIAALDQMMGGIPTGIPSLLGARPSVGKSAVALALARNVGESSGVVIFTYEDPQATWIQRTLAEVSGIPITLIRSYDLNRGQINDLYRATEKLKSTKSVAIVHAHGFTVPQLIRKARALRNKMGAKLFVIDYMQLIPNPDPRQFRKKADAVAENLRLLAEFAGQDDVAVLVLWQLTREFSKRGDAPRDYDFCDSTAAEQFAKFILAIWEPPGDDELEMIVVKNNNGPIGKFRLPFDRPIARVG